MFGNRHIGWRARRAGQDRVILLPQDIVEDISLVGIEDATLLNQFANSLSEVREPKPALIAELARRRLGSLVRPARLPIRRTVSGPVRRPGAQQGHQPLVQVLVDPPQLVVSRDLVGGEAKTSEHGDQDQPVPGLEPPADGVEDHGEDSRQ